MKNFWSIHRTNGWISIENNKTRINSHRNICHHCNMSIVVCSWQTVLMVELANECRNALIYLVEYIFGWTLCTRVPMMMSTEDVLVVFLFFFSSHLICLIKTLLSHMHFIKNGPSFLASFIDVRIVRSGSYQFWNKSRIAGLTGSTIRKTKINVPYENGQINVSPAKTSLKLSWSFYTNNNNNDNYYYNHECVVCAHLPFSVTLECLVVSGQW